MPETLLVHATAVAMGGRGVLLRGPSGSGKSDLALRLIDAGARLVADDRSELSREDDAIVARPPATIAGLIEARGVGILRVDFVPACPIAMIVDLAAPAAVERLPEPRREPILGIPLPVIALAPFEASTPAKLRLALDAFTETGTAARLHQ